MADTHSCPHFSLMNIIGLLLLLLPLHRPPLLNPCSLMFLMKSYLAAITHNGQYGQAFTCATIRSCQESDSAKQDLHQELQAVKVQASVHPIGPV